MSVTGASIRERVELLLNAPEPSDEDVRTALTDGYGHVLALDSERLRIERRITELAANAEDPGAAEAGVGPARAGQLDYVGRHRGSTSISRTTPLTLQFPS